MPRSQLTIRIEDILLEKLRIIAETEKRSINNQYEYFLEKCIKEYEKQNGVINIPEK